MSFLEALVGRASRVQIGAVTVDASISEEHGIEASLSEHPVEDGSAVSDHYQLAPRSISISAVITGTPIDTGFPGATLVSSISSAVKGSDPVLDSWQEIERYFEQAVRVDIATSLKLYKNMVLTSFSVTRDAQNGQALRFSCTAREIRVVQTLTVAALQIPEPQTTTVQIVENKGKKATSTASKAKSDTAKKTMDAMPPDPGWY